MADEPERAEPEPEPTLIRPLPLVYFNNAQALATEYELSLDLGYRPAGSEGTEVAIRIVTSWEHAKRLRDLLDRLIGGYEATVGTIREFPDQPSEMTNADHEPRER